MWHNDKIELLQTSGGGYDEKFNPIEPTQTWVSLGDCKIHGNSSARKIQAADGSDFVYSYQVVMFTPSILPKAGELVRITKSDGSIVGKEMIVRGCGTTKNKTNIFV